MKVEGTIDALEFDLAGVPFNMVTGTPLAVAVSGNAASYPEGMAFDGRYVWQVNTVGSNQGSISVIRPSDGAIIAVLDNITYDLNAPDGIVFDGIYMWVSSPGGGLAGHLSQIRASDFAYIASTTSGSQPQYGCFDGKYIWVPCNGDNTLRRYLASDPTNTLTVALGTAVLSAAFDGTYVYAVGGTTIYKVHAATGVLTGSSVPFGGAGNLVGVAFDGASLWVVDVTLGRVRLDQNLNILGTYAPVGSTAFGVRFDGVSLWICHLSSTFNLVQTDLYGNTLLTINLPGAVQNAFCFDGQRMWAACQSDGYARSFADFARLSPARLVETAGYLLSGAKLSAGLHILSLDSNAGAGGAATEAMSVPGLLTTDQILGVSQVTPGANNLPLIGFNTQIADGLTGVWTLDPGAGAVIRVSVYRA